MSVDESTLTKGQLRKLNALRKSVGDRIAEEAFTKWLAAQSKVTKEARDPTADALLSALAHLQHNKGFRLGRGGVTSCAGRRVEALRGSSPIS